MIITPKMKWVPTFCFREPKRFLMIFKKINLGIFCLVILLWFVVFNSSACAQSHSHIKLDPSRISWTDLSFHAKNLWVEVSTNLQLTSAPSAEVEAVLLATPKGVPIKPVKPKAFQMIIHTNIDPVFRSPVDIYNKIWFNPMDAAALGRVRLRRGEDDFKKIYRFTQQGVFRHRKEPKDQKEALLAPEKWTDTGEDFYSYDLPQLGCPHASERSILIYIVSTALISKSNEPLSLCVFGKRQLHRVWLRPEGLHPLKVNYVEKTPQTEIRKKGTVAALKISIESQPMDSDLDEAENFSFLGFHKDIAIYIDPTSRLPMQASGIIPVVGKANLKLRKVLLRQRED